MSGFEFLMLLCFGMAWPVSVYKSYKSKENKGKSIGFLFVVFLGYLSGITHKILFNFDIIIILYIINTLMISIDIMLFYRNRKLEELK